MQKNTTQKYLYFIAFMLMASVFLPLVSRNVHIILNENLWAVIWVISLLLFYSKIFSNRLIEFTLAYGLFLFIASKTIWSSMDDANRATLFLEFYQIAIAISIITYFIQSKDYIGLAKITKWSIIFLFITAIMTIISSAIDPLYARNLTGVGGITSIKSEQEVIVSIQRYGGGNYATAIAFMCLFPILIYYYKNIEISFISKKQIIIFFIILLFALISMQIFAYILVAVAFIIIGLFGIKKIRQSILVCCLFFSVMVFIPKESFTNTLISISNLFERYTIINDRLKDLAIFIEHGADIEDVSTEEGSRAERYPMLYEIFIKSPLFGIYFLSDKYGNQYQHIGAPHLYWMNKLTTTGIVGLLFFILIPYKNIKNNLQYFNSTYKFYYILASLSIIIYGLLKAITGGETWAVLFIILPGLYYLPLLNNKH